MKLRSACIALACCASAYAHAPVEDIIQNGIVRLKAVDDAVYGARLISIENIAAGQTLTFEPADLWDVVLRNPGNGDWYHARASGAETPSGAGTTSYGFG